MKSTTHADESTIYRHEPKTNLSLSEKYTAKRLSPRHVSNLVIADVDGEPDLVVHLYLHHHRLVHSWRLFDDMDRLLSAVRI